MAIEEENATSLPGGRRLTLVTRDESGPWGQASSEIVHLVFDDQAVALITSTDGGAAHLAEQVGNKIGVPILTLSTDPTTTEINLPWIFRLGPTDAMQAQAFARDIYQDKKFQRVVLLTQDDHDGRVGGEEFVKAARAMNAPAPTRIVVEPGESSRDETMRGCNCNARKRWSSGPTPQPPTCWWLRAPLAAYRAALPLSQSGGRRLERNRPASCPRAAAEKRGSGPRTPEVRAVPRSFSQRYRQRFGTEPGIGAAEAYDAVRVLAVSLRQSGPNRARLRDALAGVSAFLGASGIIAFDHAGNDQSQATLLRIK